MPRIPRPAPATLIAFAALFIALGGPTQAAQLARKVTHHHKHSLRGPRGLPGPRGATGPAGPKGTVGPAIVRSAGLDSPGIFGNDLRGTASCLPGETATGGGVLAGPGMIVDDSPVQHAIGPSTGWEGEAQNPSGFRSAGNVFVLCVPA